MVKFRAGMGAMVSFAVCGLSESVRLSWIVKCRRFVICGLILAYIYSTKTSEKYEIEVTFHFPSNYMLMSFPAFGYKLGRTIYNKIKYDEIH